MYLRQEMVEVTNRYKELLARSEERCSELSNVNITLSERVASAENSCELAEEAAQTKVRLHHEQAMNELRAELEKQIESTTRSHSIETEELKGEWKKQTEALRSRLELEKQNALSILVSEQRRHVESMKATHENQIAMMREELKQSHAAEYSLGMQRLEDSYREQVSELRASLSRLQGAQSPTTQRAHIAQLEEQLEQARLLRATAEADQREAIDKALNGQYDQLHANYLALLQRQAESLMNMIQAPSSQSLPKIEELQRRFLSILSNLPEAWNQLKQGKGADGLFDDPVSFSTPHRTRKVPSTPLYLLAGLDSEAFGGELLGGGVFKTEDSSESLGLGLTDLKTSQAEKNVVKSDGAHSILTLANSESTQHYLSIN